MRHGKLLEGSMGTGKRDGK